MKYNYFTVHHISLSALEKRAKVVYSPLSYLQMAAWREGWMCCLDKDTRQTTRHVSDGDKRRRETERKLQVWLHQPVLHSWVISERQRGDHRRRRRKNAKRERNTHSHYYFIRPPITVEGVYEHKPVEVAQSAVSAMWQPGSVALHNAPWMITAPIFSLCHVLWQNTHSLPSCLK